MARTTKKSTNESGTGRERHISIRSIRRDPPDAKKLASVLLALAQAQAEADAEAQHARTVAAKARRAPKEVA